VINRLDLEKGQSRHLHRQDDRQTSQPTHHENAPSPAPESLALRLHSVLELLVHALAERHDDATG